MVMIFQYQTLFMPQETIHIIQEAGGLVLGGVRNIELVSRLTTTALRSVQIVLNKILATMLDISGYMFNRMFFDLCKNLKRIKNN